MRNVIDIHTLADRAGADAEIVRLAGQGLFSALSAEDPDLTKALIEASASSGLGPEDVLQILTIFAEDFRQPLGELSVTGDGSLTTRIETMASAATGGAIAAAEKAREAITSIDLSGAKTKGEKLIERIREEVETIDVDGLKDRASSAGEFLAGKARSLANVVRKDEQPNDISPDEKKH